MPIRNFELKKKIHPCVEIMQATSVREDESTWIRFHESYATPLILENFRRIDCIAANFLAITKI